MTKRCGLLVALAICSLSPSAAAEEACPPGRSYLLLRVDAALSGSQLRLAEQLRESLAARHVELCVLEAARPGSEPLGTLEVAEEEGATATSITVNDGVTQKRVRRDLDLRTMPADGRSLAIAVALDELLRASWAELLLADRPPVVVPPVVQAAIAPAQVAMAPVPRWEVGLLFTAEHFGAGQDLLGIDAAGAFFPLARMGVQASAGVRSGLAVRTASGEVRSSAVVGALGVRLALLPRAERLGADLLAEALVYRVSYEAVATAAGARGREGSALALFALIGPRGFYAFTPTFRATLQAGVGAPLHEARVRDESARVSGLAGLLLAGQLGLAGAF